MWKIYYSFIGLQRELHFIYLIKLPDDREQLEEGDHFEKLLNESKAIPAGPAYFGADLSNRSVFFYTVLIFNSLSSFYYYMYHTYHPDDSSDSKFLYCISKVTNSRRKFAILRLNSKFNLCLNIPYKNFSPKNAGLNYLQLEL